MASSWGCQTELPVAHVRVGCSAVRTVPGTCAPGRAVQPRCTAAPQAPWHPRLHTQPSVSPPFRTPTPRPQPQGPPVHPFISPCSHPHGMPYTFQRTPPLCRTDPRPRRQPYLRTAQDRPARRRTVEPGSRQGRLHVGPGGGGVAGHGVPGARAGGQQPRGAGPGGHVDGLAGHPGVPRFGGGEWGRGRPVR